MGVDYQGLRFLLFAAREGVSFKTPVMFGRQNFADLSVRDVEMIFGRFGRPLQIEPQRRYSVADISNLSWECWAR